MNLTVLGSGPHSGDYGGGVADEPAVRVVVGGSGLARYLTHQVVAVTEPAGSSTLHYALHEVDHEIGRTLTYGLALPCGEFTDDIALTVLYPGDEHGGDVHSLRREGVVGGDHLPERDVGGTHAEGRHFVYVALDAHPAHHVGHCGRAELLHQVGGNVVGTVRKAPFEGHGASDPFLAVGTARGPGPASGYLEGLGQVDHLVARGHPFLHGQGVEERLDGGTDLALALTDIVILEVTVVGTAHIGLHMAGARLHRHERGPEYRLVVADGIIRGHRGVDETLVVVGEDPHPDGFGKSLEDLGLRLSGLLENAPAVAPAAGLVHHPVAGGLVYVVGERRVGLVLQVLHEIRLEGTNPFRHGLFGIFLHLVIDGRVDPQAVLVEVIMGTVGLGVLFDPSVELVVGPGEGVCREILTDLVVGTVGLLGGHHALDHVPEIGSPTGVVVLDLIVQGDRNLLDGIPLGLVDVAGLFHLANHEIPAVQGLVGIEGGIVASRLVGHAHQHGALLHVEFGRHLAEESLRGGADSVCVASEEDGVEIHRHDLVLGVVPLQLYGGDPFLQLGPEHLEMVDPGDFPSHAHTRVERLGQLLCDGAASSLVGLAQEDGLEQHAAKPLEVYSRMPVETGVLGGYCGVDDVGGEFFVSDVGPVLYMESRKDFTSFSYDLRRKLAVRVLQFPEGRDVGEHPDEQDHEHQEQYRKRNEYPEPLGDFLSCLLSHNKDKFITKFGKLPGLWFTLQFEKSNYL